MHPALSSCEFPLSVTLVQQGVDEVDDMAACARIAGRGPRLACLQRAEELLQDLAHVGRQHGVIGVQHRRRLLQPLQLDARILHMQHPHEPSHSLLALHALLMVSCTSHTSAKGKS